MNVQIYLNIYDKIFGRLKKRTYLCIVNLINVMGFCSNIENTLMSAVSVSGLTTTPQVRGFLKRFLKGRGVKTPLFVYLYL
jgi:hypothetical protein